MRIHRSQEEGFWAVKGKQIKSQMRTKSLGRGREGEGESLQERCSHMGPSGAQEYSSLAVVEKSEVGG
jgi:hypothetical protein